MSQSQPSARYVFVGLVVFLSGAGALVYQVVWQRVLTQEIGLDASSMATIVSVFMFGLGFGSRAGAELSHRYRGNLARLYAGIEIATGAYGFVAIGLLRGVNGLLAEQGVVAPLGILAVNFGLLVVPTLIMGLTLPVILQLVTSGLGNLGRTVGIFYGLNIAGAAVGALAAGFALIELFGLTTTTWLAAGVNFVIGIAFFGASYVLFPQESGAGSGPSSPAAAAPPKAPIRWYLASFLFGCVSLAYEIILFRLDSTFLGSHVYVFPLMLSTYLAMMALGNSLSGFAIDRIPPRGWPRYLAWLFAATGIATLLVFHLPGHWIRSWAGDDIWSASLVFIPLSMLPILPLSAFFPVVVKHLTTDPRHSGHAMGMVLFWYTVGNLAGCLVTAFVLFEAVGTVQATRIWLAALFGAVLLTGASFGSGKSGAVLRVGVLIGLLLVVAAALPGDYWYRAGVGFDAYLSADAAKHAGERRPLEAAEDNVGVLQYYTNFPSAGIDVGGAPAAQVFTHARFLPLNRYDFSSLSVFDPEFRPERVLVVGMGAAAHVWGLTTRPELRRLVVVELSAEVDRMVRRYSDRRIAGALDDPRVEVVIGDGRRYLQSAAARGERFDLIQLGTFYPDQAGSANLYSTDLIALAKSLLSATGYFSTLDCTGSIASALRVFENGYLFEPMPLYAFFSDHEVPELEHRRITRKLARSYMATGQAPLRPNLVPAQLEPLAGAILPRSMIERHLENSDDMPRYEYWFLRQRAKRLKWLRARAHQMKRLRVTPFRLEVELR